MEKQTTLFDIPPLAAPLHYIGSKKQLQKHLIPYMGMLIKRGSAVSPFVGGGSVELLLASNGIRVYASDIDPLIVNFWNVLLSRPHELNDLVVEYWNIRSDQPQWWDEVYGMQPLEQAAVYWVVNRTSFRGFGFADGPKCLNRTPVYMHTGLIKKYRDFKAPNLFVEHLDYRQALSKHEDRFAYLDPPYVDKEYYYYINRKGTLDHKELRDLLAKRSSPWLLSYNDHDYVKELYQDFHIDRIPWCSNMSKSKNRLREELPVSYTHLTLPTICSV